MRGLLAIAYPDPLKTKREASRARKVRPKLGPSADVRKRNPQRAFLTDDVGFAVCCIEGSH